MDSRQTEFEIPPGGPEEDVQSEFAAPACISCEDDRAGDAEGAGSPAVSSEAAAAARADDDGGGSLLALESQIRGEDSGDEEPIVASQSASAGCECNLPDALVELTSKRIRIWSELLSLDEGRRKLCAGVGVREIRDEAARQDRELQKAPTPEMLVRSMAEITKRLANPVLADAPAPTKPDDPKPEEIYRKLLESGLTQCKLLRLRAHLDNQVSAAALLAVENEPLFDCCERLGIEIRPLMGWTYYAMGLFQRLAECRREEDKHSAQMAAARASQSGGMMSRLKNACLGTQQQQLAPLDPAVRRTRSAIEKELRIIDPVLSEWFWKLYADVAWALAKGDVQEAEMPAVRALLRYGMVAGHPGLIAPELRSFIIEDCTRDVYRFAQTTEALHVAYADEYITAIHDRQLSASPDEDLELNSRGSEQWKADRTWRQVAAYAIRGTLYESRLQELKTRVEELTALSEKQKNEFAHLRGRSDPRVSELGEQLASNRVALAHTKLAVERFEGKLIPEINDRLSEAQQKFEDACKLLTPEMAVRREALFIRRLVRLACRLKEPYLPFVLRDTLVPGRSDHFSRASVTEAVQKLEKADCRIFHEMVINNKRPERRITVRMSPTFLIIPGRGQLGLSLSPRKWDDFGRMVLPIGFQRQNALDSLLIDVLSDFRWDCSKEDAGPEWVTADALCAAYAAVRWNFRRLSDEAQATMGLDRKSKDRENWRVHYRLYMTSAQDHGRYLFNKCYDIYKNVVLRHIGMPPGVEPLRRD